MKKILAIAAALVALSAPAFAANTVLWSPKSGDLVFPLSPPKSVGNVPGALDNTVIGATTPKAGSFSALSAQSFTSSDGVVCPSYVMVGAGAATDAVFFIANRAYTVVSARAVFSVAAGGASVLQVTKDTGTNAPGAGSDLLSNNTNGGFDLNATANTVQTGTFKTTPGLLSMAAGDRLAVDFAQAIQSSAGVVVTVCLAPQ